MAKHNSFRRKDVAGPPSGEPWVYHSLTLLLSLSRRGRSMALNRLIEFLEIENGSLLAPYNALVKFGIRQASIVEGRADG
jgi:hypothetical protein